MLFWTESISLPDVTEDQLVEAIGREQIDDGWIAQLEITGMNYLHSMAFERPDGRMGFYLERRGPELDEWHEGVTRDRTRVTLPRPWWQFWAESIETFLFEREEMLSAFRQFLNGEDRPSVADWTAIPPSY
ncbi:hypothetical protein [Erythrobacter sp. THAF29]|uniref:hypothetical protein n=1 Tax=Erythrobacter sp. THAF29 TaxID=2587851 RepID=UPI0012691145|nr:hypothetical protein [Erythrobacter sp. THAF29]QFT76610.1 hypothetical protein FIU90_03535 [Erythrobacter sp. THAF29]